MRFIPRTRPCDHCGGIIQRRPKPQACGTRGALAGTAFCDRECQKAHFRGCVACAWPDCGEERLVEANNFKRKASKDWLCAAHTDAMERKTGSRVWTAKKAAFLAGRSMDHKRLTWPFLKFVIFERDGGCCRTCGVALTFGKKPAEFHLDHVTPAWLGGDTSMSNLQLLCIPCHRRKSAAEQKQVNQTRWSGRLGSGRQRMTHFEKDALIARLLEEIEGFRRQVESKQP